MQATSQKFVVATFLLAVLALELSFAGSIGETFRLSERIETDVDDLFNGAIRWSGGVKIVGEIEIFIS